MRRLLLLAALFLATLGSSRARAQNLTCGIHCGTGTYTSCNDGASLVGGAQAISCSASQGSCTGETFCATLGTNLPASAFPLDIEELILVAAGAAPMSAAMPFDLSVYREMGTAAPGPQIGTTYNLSVPGSQTSALQVDLTSGGLSPIRVGTAGAFRVCLRKQFDAGHNVCLDTNGPTAGRNWAFVGIAVNPANPCGSTVVPPAWYSANQQPFPGLSGDFILRATIRPSALTGVPGYADCTGAGDAGVGDATLADAGTVDAGSVDAGPADAAPADAGSVDASADAGPRDAGSQDVDPADAAPLEDAGEADAQITDGGPTDTGRLEDAGSADAGSPISPPVIEALSPRAGPFGAATPITITGRGFASGLSARLGQIPLVDVAVAGSTTVRATVPAGVAAGAYDLVVTNPDGQSAILSEAFTIEGESAAGAAADGCRCAAPRKKRGASAAILPVLALLLARVRRRLAL